MTQAQFNQMFEAALLSPYRQVKNRPAGVVCPGVGGPAGILDSSAAGSPDPGTGGGDPQRLKLF